MITSLLVQTDDNPQFRALLEHLDVNRKRLSRKLTSRQVRTQLPSRYTRPRLWVWEREGRLVFEPARLATVGVGAERVPTAAIVTPADSPPLELGALTLKGLSMFGSADDPDAAPFWTRFDARTLEGFMRRARLVLVSATTAASRSAPRSTRSGSTIRFVPTGPPCVRQPTILTRSAPRSSLP